MLDQELDLALATLSEDDDEAARLLSEMRTERGWGEKRFAGMLFRNAGLRLLVKDRVQVPENLVRQAYELRHGKRYRVRIIVTDTLRDATEVQAKLREGASFASLAATHSTDLSAAQGGLLSPMSPADPSYPQAVRDALGTLEEKNISDTIAADQRFIIMKLDGVIPAEPVEYAQVRSGLESAVRRELQGQMMQQAARTMLAEATVVVLDPALNKSWRAEQAKTQPR